MESGGEEDDAFTMGEREWQKMNRDLSKQGYRDGKNEGREQGRQKGFETGTKLSLQRAGQLGQFLGIIEWKLVNKSLSQSSAIDKEGNEMKLRQLQNAVMSYLETLKKLEDSPTHFEDCDKYQKLIEVLNQEYLQMYPSEKQLITKMLES